MVMAEKAASCPQSTVLFLPPNLASNLINSSQTSKASKTSKISSTLPGTDEFSAAFKGSAGKESEKTGAVAERHFAALGWTR